MPPSQAGDHLGAEDLGAFVVAGAASRQEATVEERQFLEKLANSITHNFPIYCFPRIFKDLDFFVPP